MTLQNTHDSNTVTKIYIIELKYHILKCTNLIFYTRNISTIAEYRTVGYSTFDRCPLGVSVKPNLRRYSVRINGSNTDLSVVDQGTQ